MKFAITTIIASLALANLGFAAPAASPASAESLGQRSPNPEVDWKTKLGWDGTITPIEKIGEIVSSPKQNPEGPKALAKRTNGGIYICPAYDWQGQFGIGCSYIIASYTFQCIRMSDDYYRYTLSAVGPDPGTWCYIYQSTDCSWGGSQAFGNPGLARLEGDYWGWWNDNTGSIMCWW